MTFLIVFFSSYGEFCRVWDKKKRKHGLCDKLSLLYFKIMYLLKCVLLISKLYIFYLYDLK